MSAVIPQNHRHLRDAFGSTITDGACVIDHDREVGYVRLDLGPGCPGPDSAYWDGWFNVTRTRTEHPLRGKVMARWPPMTWHTVTVAEGDLDKAPSHHSARRWIETFTAPG